MWRQHFQLPGGKALHKSIVCFFQSSEHCLYLKPLEVGNLQHFQKWLGVITVAPFQATSHMTVIGNMLSRCCHRNKNDVHCGSDFLMTQTPFQSFLQEKKTTWTQIKLELYDHRNLQAWVSLMTPRNSRWGMLILRNWKWLPWCFHPFRSTTVCQKPHKKVVKIVNN